jgi:hypothetical protein
MTHETPKPNHLLIAVITTSGSWPAEGFDEVPTHQPVRQQLKHAADKLHIKDTSNWIATVDGRDIPLNVEQNYIENALEGRVEIHWGPREGGGGAAA